MFWEAIRFHSGHLWRAPVVGIPHGQLPVVSEDASRCKPNAGHDLMPQS